MGNRINSLISLAFLCALLFGCGTEQQSNSLSSQSGASATQVAISTKCDQMDAKSGLKARISVSYTGTKYGNTIVGSRKSFGELEPILGSNDVRESFTRSKDINSKNLCSEPLVLKANMISDVIADSLRRDFWEWSEPQLDGVVVKMELYKPAGIFTKLSIVHSVPLVSFKNGFFEALNESFDGKVPGIGAVAVKL